ncbi:MAG: SprT family zinc-dependent metalloprotease [Pseudomonadota bacterium]
MAAEQPASGGQLALPEHQPTGNVLEGLRIRESTRAKRLSIHVCPHKGVEVVVPRATSAARVQRFVEEHRGWIEQTRARLIASPCAAFDQSLPDRVDLRAIDAAWRVLLEPEESALEGRVRLSESATDLILRGNTGHTGRARDELRRWLAAKGRTYLVPWTARLAKHHGFEHGRIQVRGQKTRWGSCSSRGTLSLNYSLLFLEPSLVRYVMLHELAHTRVMSHSDRFWALLCAMEPRARQLDRQLNDAWRDIPGWAIPR